MGSKLVLLIYYSSSRCMPSAATPSDVIASSACCNSDSNSSPRALSAAAQCGEGARASSNCRQPLLITESSSNAAALPPSRRALVHRARTSAKAPLQRQPADSFGGPSPSLCAGAGTASPECSSAGRARSNPTQASVSICMVFLCVELPLIRALASETKRCTTTQLAKQYNVQIRLSAHKYMQKQLWQRMIESLLRCATYFDH